MSNEDDDIPPPRPAFEERLLDERPSFSSFRSAAAHPTTAPSAASSSTLLFPLVPSLVNALSFEESMRRAASTWTLLLVNIIDEDNFQCSVMNRDVWNNTTVAEVLGATYVFWQRSYRDPECANFRTLYKVVKFPFLGVVLPLTGQLVKSFDLKKMDTESSAVAELLDVLDLKPIKMYLQRKEELVPAPPEAARADRRHSTPLQCNDEEIMESAAKSPAYATFPGRQRGAPGSVAESVGSNSRGKRSRPISLDGERIAAAAAAVERPPSETIGSDGVGSELWFEDDDDDEEVYGYQDKSGETAASKAVAKCRATVGSDERQLSPNSRKHLKVSRAAAAEEDPSDDVVESSLSVCSGLSPASSTATLSPKPQQRPTSPHSAELAATVAAEYARQNQLLRDLANERQRRRGQ